MTPYEFVESLIMPYLQPAPSSDTSPEEASPPFPTRAQPPPHTPPITHFDTFASPAASRDFGTTPVQQSQHHPLPPPFPLAAGTFLQQAIASPGLLPLTRVVNVNISTLPANGEEQGRMSDVSNDKVFVRMREGNFSHCILTLARPPPRMQ